MLICVRQSVSLLGLFHMLRWSWKGSSLIGPYYFHLWAKGPIVYIVPIRPDRWVRWRKDWVIVRANVHGRLVLPTKSPTARHGDWEEVPKLRRAYKPMIERIKHLMSHGLSSMMVVHDFLSRRIAPLQDRARPAWLYTRESDTTPFKQGRRSDFASNVLVTLLGRLSPDPSSTNFVTPLTVCVPICSDQVT
jgi:hypothetical protein